MDKKLKPKDFEKTIYYLRNKSIDCSLKSKVKYRQNALDILPEYWFKLTNRNSKEKSDCIVIGFDYLFNMESGTIRLGAILSIYLQKLYDMTGYITNIYLNKLEKLTDFELDSICNQYRVYYENIDIIEEIYNYIEKEYKKNYLDKIIVATTNFNNHIEYVFYLNQNNSLTKIYNKFYDNDLGYKYG